jgi:hypothetical protein
MFSDTLSQLKSTLESLPIYWFCALIGSGMFLIQFVLSFVGLHDDVDSDDGGRADAGKFKWLSKQGLTGFLMMFGWAGLTCLYEFKLAYAPTLLIAIASGLATLFMTAFIFNTAKKLQSPGSIFNIEEAIGKEATVYQSIPEGGFGKITISLNCCTFELNAASDNQEEICSFTPVQVINKIDDNTVVVSIKK